MHDLSPTASKRLPLFPILLAALIYALAWTVLPVMLSQSIPIDVSESLSWGKEWQWGYYKHPPLAPIVLNLFYELLGRFGPYLLSQLCIGLTLWMVWRTGCRLMDRSRAFLGTVLTMGVAYYNFPAIEFNHNIAQMPLWAALGYAFVAALQDGKLRQWLMLGLLAGLGLLTKYSMAVLLLSFGLYMLCHAPSRRQLLRPGPWLAVVLMLLVFAPHALWLQASQGLPFAYASSRALAQGGNPRLQALEFPVTQLLAHVPLLLIVAFAWWRSRRPAIPAAPRWQLHTSTPSLLLTLGLLPMVIVTLLGVALGMRLRDMWGSPMWAFSGLLLMACLRDEWLTRMQPRLLRGTGVWLLLITLFMAVYVQWGAQLRKRPARMDWPAISIGQQATNTWQQHAGSCPLDTVAGHYWLTGLLSAFVPSRPSVLIDGDPRYSPWVTAQRLQSQGTLWVWQDNDSAQSPVPPEPLASLKDSTALKQYQGEWHFAWPKDASAEPLTLNWRAYVPAHCQQP